MQSSSLEHHPCSLSSPVPHLDALHSDALAGVHDQDLGDQVLAVRAHALGGGPLIVRCTRAEALSDIRVPIKTRFTALPGCCRTTDVSHNVSIGALLITHVEDFWCMHHQSCALSPGCEALVLLLTVSVGWRDAKAACTSHVHSLCAHAEQTLREGAV